MNHDGSDGKAEEIFDETFDLGRTGGLVQFSKDPYLAERHCRFISKDSTWTVQDLDTRNGIYFRIKKPWQLSHGDHLLLGKQVLVFEQLSDHERDLAPAVENGVLIFGSPLRTPWGRLRQMTVAGVCRDVFHLIRSEVQLGREDGHIIFPDDEFMSRSHLTISSDNGTVVVQDNGSSNGTYIRLIEPQTLISGDMIRVGDQLLRFETV